MIHRYISIMIFFHFLAILCSIFAISLAENEEFVEILNGKLLGKDNGNYKSFYGIPYAKPPVNDLRFEPPQAYEEKWVEVRNADKPPEVCIQLDYLEFKVPTFVGTEDCLFVNVHTPNLKPDELLPVMVYIHGGGFMFGSGNQFGEKYLMREAEMILVTFNYRLAQFGFLSTEDNVISGNMGLKDQQMALKWVKSNIERFGGDPDKILLTGFSAGGASVEYQLLNPESAKLINSAISFSGSALNSWAFEASPKKHAIKLAELVDCSSKSSTTIKNCLQKIPALDIVKTIAKFQNFIGFSVGYFAPVAEPKSVESAFITETPRNLLKNGYTCNVPWLASYTKEDGGMFTGQLLNLLNIGAPKEIIDTLDALETDDGVQRAKKYYENLVSETKKGKVKEANKYFTDHVIKNGIIEALQLRRKYTKDSTFSYVYKNPPKHNIGNIISGNMKIKFGTAHGDDVTLLLNSELRERFPIRDDEKEISRKLIKLLENFAKNRTPIFDDTEIPENKPGSKNTLALKIMKDSTEVIKLKDLKTKIEKTEKIKTEL